MHLKLIIMSIYVWRKVSLLFCSFVLIICNQVEYISSLTRVIITDTFMIFTSSILQLNHHVVQVYSHRHYDSLVFTHAVQWIYSHYTVYNQL